MKYKLTETDIAQLAEMFGIGTDELLTLSNFELLNRSKLTKILVRKEYAARLAKGDARKMLVITELMNKYNLSQGSIEAIVYDKSLSSYSICKKCEVKTTKYTLSQNNGFCNNCNNKK